MNKPQFFGYGQNQIVDGFGRICIDALTNTPLVSYQSPQHGMVCLPSGMMVPMFNGQLNPMEVAAVNFQAGTVEVRNIQQAQQPAMNQGYGMQQQQNMYNHPQAAQIQQPTGDIWSQAAASVGSVYGQPQAGVAVHQQDSLSKTSTSRVAADVVEDESIRRIREMLNKPKEKKRRLSSNRGLDSFEPVAERLKEEKVVVIEQPANPVIEGANIETNLELIDLDQTIDSTPAQKQLEESSTPAPENLPSNDELINMSEKDREIALADATKAVYTERNLAEVYYGGLDKARALAAEDTKLLIETQRQLEEANIEINNLRAELETAKEEIARLASISTNDNSEEVEKLTKELEAVKLRSGAALIASDKAIASEAKMKQQLAEYKEDFVTLKDKLNKIQVENDNLKSVLEATPVEEKPSSPVVTEEVNEVDDKATEEKTLEFLTENIYEDNSPEEITINDVAYIDVTASTGGDAAATVLAIDYEEDSRDTTLYSGMLISNLMFIGEHNSKQVYHNIANYILTGDTPDGVPDYEQTRLDGELAKWFSLETGIKGITSFAAIREKILKVSETDEVVKQQIDRMVSSYRAIDISKYGTRIPMIPREVSMIITDDEEFLNELEILSNIPYDLTVVNTMLGQVFDKYEGMLTPTPVFISKVDGSVYNWSSGEITKIR